MSLKEMLPVDVWNVCIFPTLSDPKPTQHWDDSGSSLGSLRRLLHVVPIETGKQSGNK